MRLGAIWEIGTTADMDLEDRKLVMFSNGIYFIAGSILILAEIIMGGFLSIFTNPSIRTLTPFLLIGLATFSLVLNRFHFFLISRIIFIITWTFLVSVLPIITLGPTPLNYFFHPFYIIVFSPVIHLLFSRPKDRNYLIFFLFFSGASVLFSIDFLLMFDKSATPGPPLVKTLSTLRINLAVLWIFLNLLMAYILRTYWGFYVSLREQKEIISTQRKQLQVQNDKVHQLNEVLEKRVNERTHELTERNRILSDYAFMNAHLLRSPISRIKGLINLFKITNDPEDKRIVEESLLKSTEELDQVVHSISEKLNEAK